MNALRTIQFVAATIVALGFAKSFAQETRASMPEVTNSVTPQHGLPAITPSADATRENTPAESAPSASPSQSAPTQVSSYPDWSGQSGSSGHPLMTADAIRAA